MNIQLKDINFSKFSAIDTFGKVFYHDSKVYRLIAPEYQSFCLEWFKNGLIEQLNGGGLIPFTAIEQALKIEEYPDALILNHEKLVETYIGEWSFSMIKKAALTILKLNELLNTFGYELKDSHPFNILFRGKDAVWVDLGSISKKTTITWVASNEFIDSFYIPLKLWQNGEFYFLNKALNDKWFPHQRFLPALNIRSSKLIDKSFYDSCNRNLTFRTSKLDYQWNIYFNGIETLTRGLNFLARKSLGKTGSPLQINYTLKPSKEVAKLIEAIKKPAQHSAWSNYHTQYYSEKVSERLTYIVDKCIALDKKTILDLAGNQGLVGSLIDQKTNNALQIITTDYDENALDFGFNHSESPNNNLNFVLINCILAGQRDQTIYKRLKSDIVLALAVTHHLVLGQGYNLDYILNEFKQFTNEYLLIEFMPKGLWKEGDEFPELPAWYNEKWFEEKLSVHFEIVEKMNLETNRILYIAKINETEN